MRRPATQRPTPRPTAGPATRSHCAGRRSARSGRRTRCSASTRRGTGTSSARPPATSLRRRRTWCTPTCTATSATRHPGVIPIRRTGERRLAVAGLGPRLRVGLELRAVRRAAERAGPEGRLRRDGQPGGRRAEATRTTSATPTTTASASQRIRDLLAATPKLTVDDMASDPARHVQQLAQRLTPAAARRPASVAVLPARARRPSAAGTSG